MVLRASGAGARVGVLRPGLSSSTGVLHILTKGVQLVEEEFAERASAQMATPERLEAPSGTELMAFWSAH